MAARRSEKIMGTPVMILGASGTGKSASMRNLDLSHVGLVNVAKKPLPFRGSIRSLDSDDYQLISATIARAKSDIIVIDDAQFLMANEYMRSAMVKYSRDEVFAFYKQVSYNFWSLVQQVVNMPPEKIVYFLGHVELDEMGRQKFKTVGKLLDNYCVEGLFTIVLHTRVADGHFYFSTVNDGTDTVKTPMGMFSEPYIDNDLALVDAAIRDYYGLTKKEPKVEKSLI
jgi:hypothetical protein